MDETPFIWIASYPKSGSTWMRSLIREYFRAINPEELPFETNDTVPYYYHTVSPYPVESLDLQGLTQLRPAAMMHMMALHKSRLQPSPAVLVKTHMVSGEMYGVPFFSPLWADRVIYIRRDPRDILPSLADHMGKTLEETVEFMGRPTATMGLPPKIPTPVCSWSEHVGSWAINSRDIPTHITSYEEMHKQPAEELYFALKFCGLKPDGDAIRMAVEASRFSEMQKREEEEGFREATEHQERFFRRGIVGSHKDEVPEEVLERLGKDHRGHMERLGYV